ncbi:MAG: cache domain-containing protein [Gemmatimonadota bacterium]|nr:cache domain-containing protein [Gemmatimonadota bacterium]
MKSPYAVLTLAAICLSLNPASAQDRRTTAGDVMDRETLMAFVDAARDSLESAPDYAVVGRLVEAFRTEGDWKAGPVYLVILTPEGVVSFHAADVTFEDRNVLDLEDDRGTKLVRDMLAAAGDDGGFVEYYWDDPAVEDDEPSRLAYAVSVSIQGDDFILVAGFHLDLSDVDAEPSIFELLEVTARDVRDRESLRAFVEGLRVLVPLIEEKGYGYLATVQAAIRTEGEDFKHGSIYIFVISTSGYLIFHGTADLSLIGENMIDVEDVNGLKIVQEIIAKAEAGGGFVKYYWDNPAIIGDEDTKSPKLSYVIPVNVFGQTFIVGAGIYLDSDIAFEDVAQVEVQIVGDGDPGGLTVEVSRSISGRAPVYAWRKTTDDTGHAVVRVTPDEQRRVNGMYRARVRRAEGETIASWSSIPLMPGRHVTYEVNLNGEVNAVSHLAASLDANRPNPFNPATTIRYSLEKAVDVELAIYNLLGQEVRLLVRQFQSAGNYSVVWDGRDAAGRQVSTGVYLYRLRAGTDVVARKMVLAK